MTYNSTVSTLIPTPAQNRPTAVSECHSRTGSRRERTGSHFTPRRSSRRQASPSRSTRNSHAAPASTSACNVSYSTARFMSPALLDASHQGSGIAQCRRPVTALGRAVTGPGSAEGLD